MQFFYITFDLKMSTTCKFIGFTVQQKEGGDSHKFVNAFSVCVIPEVTWNLTSVLALVCCRSG